MKTKRDAGESARRFCGRFFRPGDLAVYAAIFAIVVALFLSVGVFSRRESASGFTVLLGGERVLSFTYENALLTVSDGFEDKVDSVREVDAVYITVYSGENNAAFNRLTVDLSQKTVRVTDANCPHKTCTACFAVSSSGAIVCVPHGLKVLPLSPEDVIVL